MNQIYQYIIDKKLYHPIFWFSYFSFWVFISGPFSIESLGINLIYLVFTVIPVYFNSIILMRKLLNKGKYISYTFSLLLLIACCSYLLYLSLFGFFEAFSIPGIGMFDGPYIIGSTLGAVASTTLVLMIVEIIKNSRKTQRENQQLEREKLETELKFLRSQLNPHFLFNALNNIYFLIQKDQTKAADALAQFSEMLRYQLYDCNVEKIPLAQEVEYLKNYIKIASLSHKEVDIKVDITDNINGQLITPLLLIPFVENAFKYVSSEESKDKFVDITLDLNNKNLKYRVSNSFSEVQITEKKRGGIGLDNIQKRLKLLYPGEHQLAHEQLNDSYLAELKLEL